MLEIQLILVSIAHSLPSGDGQKSGGCYAAASAFHLFSRRASPNNSEKSDTSSVDCKVQLPYRHATPASVPIFGSLIFTFSPKQS